MTEQQKKIALIASLALSLLAAAYFIYRCCFKATKDRELPIKNEESAVETVQSPDKKEEKPIQVDEPTQANETQKKNEKQPAQIIRKFEDKEPPHTPEVDAAPKDPFEEIAALNEEGE